MDFSCYQCHYYKRAVVTGAVYEYFYSPKKAAQTQTHKRT